MSFQIIIKGKAKYGKTLAEISQNLGRDGISDSGLFRNENEKDHAIWIDNKYGLRKMDANTMKKIKERERK